MPRPGSKPVFSQQRRIKFACFLNLKRILLFLAEEKPAFSRGVFIFGRRVIKTKSDFPSINEKKPDGFKDDETPFRVLIVDDSMFVKKQLSQILGSEGFDVVDTAANGQEAIEKYKVLFPKIDLVTMDITMPVMEGIESLKHIMEFDKNAKVIMVSAIGKEDMVKQSLLLGAKNYIVKPLDRKKVLDRVLKVLRK
jgi:two-component system, chemotaxis family, chemotaxis protein CheY